MGKSSLVLRFVKGQFHEYQESTIGGECPLRMAAVTSCWPHSCSPGVSEVLTATSVCFFFPAINSRGASNFNSWSAVR